MDTAKILWSTTCFLLIISLASSTIPCEVDDVHGCTYTVTCVYHPGSAPNPACNGEANVTFVIRDSLANEVTTSFFGATNFDARVRSIIAIQNSWPTLSQHSFRYYAKSTRIDLSGNKIRVVESDTFKTLLSLRHLNLSHNDIDHFESDSFKVSDNKLGNMEVLDLSFNQLTYLTDEVLSELPSLYTLYLNGNRLKSLSDSCFSGLKYLDTLYLQHNDMVSLNLTLVNLKSLTILDLSFNHLVKLIGYETNRLQSIKTLNMSHNDIDTIDSNCFSELAKLQMIDLSFNAIRSTIKSSMFESNSELDFLDLGNNRISFIEDESFKYNPLRFFNFENNNFTGVIEKDTFAGLDNITKLDLSKQNITELRDKAFGYMTQLAHLNISSNHINNIGNSAFFNSTLSVLDISYNNITKLCFVKYGLLNLTELLLSNNKITFIEANLFQTQSLLKKLDLSSNEIVKVDANALPLTSLQYFNIQCNKLTGEISTQMFSPAKMLRFLDLSNYNLTKVNQLAFVDMPVLARLNLSHNAIDSIEANNFKNMNNMYSLDISYNRLQTLQLNHSLLNNLKSAYLNNNNLLNISGIFPENCKISYLDMSHNGLSDLSNFDAKIFPNLQVLRLSHNNIELFNNNHTNTLGNLVDLRLSSNRLSNIDLSYFKELLIVNLSNNNFSSINNTFLKNIDFLQSLDMSYNKLVDLPPGTFQNMKNLKLLNLSSNYISQLRYGSLKGLHKTELLDVSNNMIAKLDVHVFHECTELKTLVIDYNRIKTLDITKLALITQRKLRTLSLGGNPISCQEIIRNTTVKDLTYYVSQIDITSRDKIYHEDNVHGIKCGDDSYDTTVTGDVVEKSESTSTAVVIIWCSILTVVVLGAGVLLYMKLKKQNDVLAIYRNSSMTLRSSLDLNSSEYQNNLL